MSDCVAKSKLFFLPGGSAGRLVPHGFSCMPEEMQPVEGMGHSLVMDPKRQLVFETVARFIAEMEK